MKEKEEEKLKIAWFGDCNSMGYRKIENYEIILMEVKEGTAAEAFKKYFDRDPDGMSGWDEDMGGTEEDFIYDEYDDIGEACSFERQRKGLPLKKYLELPEVLFVPYTLYQEKIGETPKKSKKSKAKATANIDQTM